MQLLHDALNRFASQDGRLKDGTRLERVQAYVDFVGKHRRDFEPNGMFAVLLPALEASFSVLENDSAYRPGTVARCLAVLAWDAVDICAHHPKGAVRTQHVVDLLQKAAVAREDDWLPTKRDADLVNKVETAVEGSSIPLNQAARAYNILAFDSRASVRPDTREPPRDGLARLLKAAHFFQSKMGAPPAIAEALRKGLVKFEF